jgi:hypothetical protein
MKRVLSAGFVYFSAVFAVGFVLGTLRYLVFAPVLGETAAVAFEIPLLLTVSWFVSEAITDLFVIDKSVAQRMAMGGIAFALLMIAEGSLSMLVFGRTAAQHLASYSRPASALGLCAQMAFAIIPLVQLRLGTTVRWWRRP